MKYERTGCLLVPKQICCGKDESSCLKYLLKLSGKASRQHRTEWIEVRKEEGWERRCEGRRTKQQQLPQQLLLQQQQQHWQQHRSAITAGSEEKNCNQNTSIYTGNGWKKYRDAILEKKTILIFVIVEHVCAKQSLSLVIVSSWCGVEGCNNTSWPQGEGRPRPKPLGHPPKTTAPQGQARTQPKEKPGGHWKQHLARGGPHLEKEQDDPWPSQSIAQHRPDPSARNLGWPTTHCKSPPWRPGHWPRNKLSPMSLQRPAGASLCRNLGKCGGNTQAALKTESKSPLNSVTTVP